MELRHLRYFVAVAEELNFTKAAQHLNTAQPSLSQQIRDLEDEVGTSLFRRNSRAVTLTAAGKIFLQEARALLSQVPQAVARARQAAEEEFSRLSVGVIPSAEMSILPVVLPFLRSQYPNIEIALSSRASRDLLHELATYDIDVAFVPGTTFDPSVGHTPIISETLQVVLPALHPLAQKATITSKDLEDYPYVASAMDSEPQFFSIIQGFFAQHDVNLRVAQSTPMHLLSMTLAGSNSGFGFLPSSASLLHISNIVCRPLLDSPVLTLSIVWRKGDDRNVLKCFRDLVSEVVDSHRVVANVIEFAAR